MKVILTTHVKGIAQKGDVKEVSDGYFKNFLLPKKLAVQATSGQVNLVNAQKAKAVEKLENMKESALSIKSKVEGKTLTLNEKVSEAGKLYAALHSKEVKNALKQQLGVDVPEKQIVMDAVKNAGSFPIELHLHKEVKASLTLQVLAA